MKNKTHLSRLLIALLFILSLAPSAHAQLDHLLPQAGQVPTIRFTGSLAEANDALASDLSTLVSVRADEAKQTRQAFSAAPAGDAEAAQERERISAGMETEESLLRAGLETARATQEFLAEESVAPNQASLDGLVTLERELLGAKRSSAKAEELERRVEQIVEGTPPAGVPSSWDAQALRVRYARLLAARAQVYRMRATAERLHKQIAEAAAVVHVTAVDLSEARAAHEHEGRDIREKQRILTAERRALKAPSVVELQRLDHLQMELDMRLFAARARYAAHEVLAGVPDAAAHLFDERDVSRQRDVVVSRYEDARASLESLEQRVTAATSGEARTRLQNDARAVREGMLALEGALGDLDFVHILADIVTRSGRPGFWWAALATVASLLLLCAVYFAGSRILGGALRHNERALLMGRVLWLVLVAALGLVGVTFGVWKTRIGWTGLREILVREILSVEGRSVSAASFIGLVGSTIAAVVVSTILRRWLRARVYPALNVGPGVASAFNRLVHYFVMFCGLLVGLQFVGFGLSSLALFGGVLAIGIGFGLRNVAENFISGLIILIERPVKVGDWIEMEGGLQGRVDAISGRSTTVTTRDNINVIIPNSDLVGGRVTNWSHGDTRVRIRIAVGVAYGSDTTRVGVTLREVGLAHPKVLKSPEPDVSFVAFGESSLDFELLAWIEDQEHSFKIASDLRFAIDAAFRKAGIEMPFPQRDLHVRSVAPDAVRALSSRT